LLLQTARISRPMHSESLEADPSHPAAAETGPAHPRGANSDVARSHATLLVMTRKPGPAAHCDRPSPCGGGHDPSQGGGDKAERVQRNVQGPARPGGWRLSGMDSLEAVGRSESLARSHAQAETARRRRDAPRRVRGVLARAPRTVRRSTELEVRVVGRQIRVLSSGDHHHDGHWARPWRM
jgi:hypothetical protein